MGPLPPVPLATLFANFVDVLIPGDSDWPSASAVGVQGSLLSRVVDQWGEEKPHLIAEALIAAGAPFAHHDTFGRKTIVEKFEAVQPEEFAELLIAVTLAYYDNAIVADAIRACGRPYQLRPHLTGYPSRQFDSERDAPKHGRGGYLRTGDVRPVDTSRLEHEAKPTQFSAVGR